ncbi:MAG: TonB-dependent receptor [Tannerella sp.]|jgi:outer membrane cobalamin receptor|nr:TonB-dependent receptor [Tannerella sp.]
MNRLFFLFVVVLLSSVAIQAQVNSANSYAITGQVIDSLSNKPIEFASISVASAQTPTQFIHAAACDENGKFTAQLKAPGNYILTIQSIGINTLSKTFSLTESNKRIDLGKVFVHENVQAIGEVTVTAQRPLVKVEIDKLIYNMEEDPDAKVNNTLEMLRKVPMITIDGEDNVQLKGSSNFKIYLNGKPSNMLSGRNISDVLKSMPANTIKNIEVITDPGAKYDAEGIGGIINIITTKNAFQGYQGSVAANASTFGRFGGNVYLTAKTGIFGITGSFNYNKNRSPWSQNEGVTENYINEKYYRELSNGRNRSKGGRFMYGNLEASLEFDTLRLLSLGVNLYGSQSKSISEQAIEMYNKAGDFEYSYKTDGDNRYDYGSTGISLDYQRSTFKKGELITLSYRLNDSPDGSEIYSYAKDIVGDMPLYIRRNQWFDNNARTQEHTGQLDYTNPLTAKHSIEAGIKYILRQNISKVHQYVMDTGGNWDELPASMRNDFRHINHIYAGYAGYAFKSPKFGFRTGVRAEGTQQNVEFRLDESNNFDVNYFNLVPSVTASYQLKPSQQLRFGYNLRIFRPSIWYLNPFINDANPYDISYGNPNLVPEKQNSVNLNYSFFSPKITLNANATYSYTNNAIQNYSFIDPEKPDVRQRTYGNIGTRQNAGVYVNAGWTPNQMFRINLNGSINYSDFNSEELDISKDGLFGFCFINAQLTLPKDFRIVAMGQYQSKMIWLQGSQSGIFMTNFAFNKDFLKKKMTVTLACNNPFGRYLSLTSTTTTANHELNFSNKIPMRELRLSISYRFGSMKEAIKKVQRGITNDDMKAGEGGGGAGGATGGG